MLDELGEEDEDEDDDEDEWLEECDVVDGLSSWVVGGGVGVGV